MARSHQIRIAGVGNVDIVNDVVYKTVEQNMLGSAYMKIPGQMIAIKQAGYDHIVLRVNRDHPYMSRIETQLSLLVHEIPNIKIEKI